MGTEAVIGGLFGLASAGVSAANASHVQSANAAAQANLNKKTMEFNREEAAKARNWQSNEAVVNRQYNTREALAARQFTAKQAQLMMDFNAAEAQKARSFNSQESLLARQFEERLSSSAHQREVQDLYRAGLNPILSATGGSGASTPVSPILSSPAASGSLGSSAQASSNAPSGAAASIGALNAYAKRNVLGDFVNSALDSMRVGIDYKRAEIADKEAETKAKLAEIEDKKAVQAIEESISRVGLNYDQHELNQIRKRGEEAQAKLYEEKIISEVQERLNKKEISAATVYNLKVCAGAAATAAYAQARIAELKDRIETAESPERIAKMRKEADYFKSMFDRNKWILDDPKGAAQRKWWRENPEAAHANEIFDIIGNVVHGNVGLGF